MSENQSMPSKIIVFGGAGFIGTHLIRALHGSGENDIVCIDRADPRERLDGVTYMKADVRNLDGFSTHGPIARIYDLAALCVIPKYQDHEYYDVNVNGAISVTGFAERHGVVDVVFVSSMATYGTGEDRKSEQTPQTPENAYGWSKLIAERVYLSWLQRDTNRKLVICRPAVIFGHGEGGNFTRLAKLVKWGLFVFPGRKDTKKACYYVKHLVDDLNFAANWGERLAIFNACYDHVYTIENIVRAFEEAGVGKLRTLLMPETILIIAAHLLQPFNLLGLEIHPDRIRKLTNSTNLKPAWLRAHDRVRTDELTSAIVDWKVETDGRMN